MAFLDYYRGKTVLVTGHTGFKGSWASLWLDHLGARVVGYSLDPPSSPNNFQACELASRIEHVHGDVTDAAHLKEVFAKHRPDVVLHMAAQAIMLQGFKDPPATFSTNILGTVNVCDIGMRHPSVKALVLVTSDKCYENQEWAWGYRETDRLGGYDPYGASKACAELVVGVYQDRRFRERTGVADIPVSSVRAGNVIGGGDWARDRLLPDIARAFAAGEDIHLRSPRATRPWQHVLEALSGYLWLGARMGRDGMRYQSAYNFGPTLSARGVPVGEIVERAMAAWGTTESKIVVDEDESGAESALLRLDVSRAEFGLNWTTTWSVEEAVDQSIAWYRAYYIDRPSSMRDYSVNQIEQYVEDARSKHLEWTAP